MNHESIIKNFTKYSNGFLVLAMAPAVLSLILSPMRFDATGSEKDISIWLFFISVLLYIISAPMAIFLTNKVLNMKKYCIAYIMNAIPLAILLVWLAMLGYSWFISNI